MSANTSRGYSPDATAGDCVCGGTHWIVLYMPHPSKAPCFVCNMDGSKPEARPPASHLNAED